MQTRAMKLICELMRARHEFFCCARTIETLQMQQYVKLLHVGFLQHECGGRSGMRCVHLMLFAKSKKISSAMFIEGKNSNGPEITS
jgi:hypothetical protein